MVTRSRPGIPGLDRASRYAVVLAREFHLTLVLSMVIGLATGLAIAGFEGAVHPAVEEMASSGLLVAMLVPPAGLLVVNLLGVLWRDRDTATTDAYVRAYHERGGRMPFWRACRGTLASALTLSSGHALGFEGPSMLIGGSIGSGVEQRARRRLHKDDAKVLMVAGAAAGVAAVFKAPLTGVIFALEVPYRSDFARRALLPSLVAAGTAYVTYVAIVGTEPLLSTGGTAPFDLKDLGGGLVLGVVCGVLARAGAHAMAGAKRLQLGPWTRLAISCGGLFALAPLALAWFDQPLHLGPSYDAIEWAADPSHGTLVLCALFAMRAATTWLAVTGGGAGGLFIPLVTQGAIVGSIFDHFVHAPNPRLFPTLGIAAFLGAGYRTPLAGVAFVAEATGEPGFLVPALLAAAAAQLVMGSRSFSAHQRNERSPGWTPLAEMPVTEVMSPTVDAVDADRTLDQVVESLMRQGRRWAPVVDRGRLLGLISLRDISAIEPSGRDQINARDLARSDVDPLPPATTVLAAAQRMRLDDLDAVAVAADGQVLGVVTWRELANVESLLDRLQNEAL